MWPSWSKANEKDLARFVHIGVANKIRLAKVRDDLLAAGDITGVAEAIYESLQGSDIRWARELYNPRDEVQGIRDPFEVLEGSGNATCLDLALLYAGICLGNELLALIAVFRDHALVLVALDNDRRDAGKEARQLEDGPWTESGVIDDGARMRELVEQGAYLPIECTGFAKSAVAIQDTFPEGRGRVEGLMSFADAVRAGKEQFQLAKRQLVFAVDPAVLLDIQQNEPYEPPSLGLSNLRTDLRVRLRGVFDTHRLFGGREEELLALDAAALPGPPGYLFVTGVSGTGKTALLTNWILALEGRDDLEVAYHFLSRQHDLARREDMLRTLCQQLINIRGRAGELPGSTADLEALYIELLTDNASGRPLVVVIDGLDEADGWKPGLSMFPKPSDNITVVFSAREMAGKEWLADLGFKAGEADTLTVARLSTVGVASLLRAAGGQATALAEDAEFVDRLYERSEGDPLYLQFVVGDIRDGVITNLARLTEQPQGLTAYFERWWKEDVSKDVQAGAVKDLLGYLLVGRGRLTRDDLMEISDVDALDAFSVDAAVQVLSRYVVGDERAGFSLCHPRFQEYLAAGPLKGVQRTFRQRLVDWCARWQTHRSAYAMSYYAIHLAEMLADAAAGAKEKLADDLVALVGSREYQRAFMETSGDLPWLHRQAAIALEQVAVMTGEGGMVRTVRAALVLPELRQTWLRPASVFEAAEQRRVEDARKALGLFGVAPEWREASLLLIAWIVGSTDVEAGRRFLAELELGDWLPLLKGRVEAALALGPEPEHGFSYGPRVLPGHSVDEQQAHMILRRLAGADLEGMDPQFRGAFYSGVRREEGGDDVSVRVAQRDAPELVRFALDQPDPGFQLLEQYIELHATNPYREYRNVSLWAILEAVLCVPDGDVTRRLARAIVEKALAGGTVEYREGLHLALAALRGVAQLPVAEPFANKVEEARRAAGKLMPSRLKSDQWGHHGRRLAALAEIEGRLLGNLDAARQLLSEAEQLPYGFAGFQSIASATVAEANHVCVPYDPRQSVLLEAALRSAHNVQEPVFCAFTTARINGLSRGWERAPQDLVETVQRFCRDPSSAEFSSTWRAPEDFHFRDPNSERIELPNSMRQACRLDQLAGDVFMVPVAEFLRLNPGVGVDQPLAAEVNVPDTAMAALVAAQLSALVLARDDIDSDTKASLIQQLAPAAAANATALDTVLMRLLLARPLDRPELFEAIEAVAPMEWMAEHTWTLVE